MAIATGRRPLVLMILDGWGYSPETQSNAIALANTPYWDSLCQNQPWALLETSGMAVGLPDGQMGNSEVGHMNMGAGRIVQQDFTRIENAIADGSFATNPVLCGGIDGAVSSGGSIHLMGLLSPGGVHSHESQFFEAIKLAANHHPDSIWVHVFLDGRDTPPRSAQPSIEGLEQLLAGIPGAAVASVSGRYFAMDRDRRWDRVERAYRAICIAEGGHEAESASQALTLAYDRDEGDEFVQPTVIRHAESRYRGVADGDTVIFINFRADRARELTAAFTLPQFDGFTRQHIALTAFVCMTEYQASLPTEVAFPSETLTNILGELLAAAGLRQLRIAETEKYAHVTFFFNGGREAPFPLEKRILIPSPQVSTYDLQPEMSVPELTRELVAAIASNSFDVVICNVANPDMVGHTGKLGAAIKAVEAVDRSLSSICQAVEAQGGEMLITADHGNIEQMSDPRTGQPHTAHTTNRVPLLFVGREALMSEQGSLRDIAPTMLYLLGQRQPPEMTGRSLLNEAKRIQAAN